MIQNTSLVYILYFNKISFKFLDGNVMNAKIPLPHELQSMGASDVHRSTGFVPESPESMAHVPPNMEIAPR